MADLGRERALERWWEKGILSMRNCSVLLNSVRPRGVVVVSPALHFVQSVRSAVRDAVVVVVVVGSHIVLSGEWTRRSVH